MATTARRRRTATTDDGLQESSSSQSEYSKLDKPGQPPSTESGFGWKLPLITLLAFRYMSATSNIIHDCDEVFNYWEPLHYILYKSGFQTWEYSANFALRSYLYILLHALAGGPASWLFGEEKVRVFYAVRLLLGSMSAISETVLVVALSKKYGRRMASYTLAMLCLTSGCWFASTSFLPSSFSMYTITLASALFLLERHALAVSVAAAGVLLGWPFSILAVLPVTVYSLLAGKLKQVFLSGVVTTVGVMGFSVIIDYFYYKRWTSSVFNLLIYNVLGGGQSHLYGTEGSLFYLRNGFNNFNFCFIFALLFVLILPIKKEQYAPRLLIVVSPVYIWLAFMSLQPHKEERFLYPIYPLICVSAAAVIDSFPDFFRDKYMPNDDSVSILMAKILRPVVLGLILCASHGRTFSLINGYSAPLTIYKHLGYHDDAGAGSVLCVGSEWHRFPSSFFIPSYIGELRNIEACTFLIELDLRRAYPTRGSDLSTWETVAALPYLDRELSPAKYRAFFIPYLWQQNNVFGLYKLLKRIPT
ncbi:Dol-P-ManMan(6)GlcNAc(2)-PP-Dol alpha-1-2-mannosyltransferase [Nymphaea thermarum]|nr:Dol-P-ManMan(6)GlcNAc(2)-PP-Dol alpha-1-2-mannosyltransferase [Nymphaea thermarum]